MFFMPPPFHIMSFSTFNMMTHPCWGSFSPCFSQGKHTGEYLWWFLDDSAHFLSILTPPAPTTIPPTCLPHQLSHLLFYCFDGVKWVGMLLFLFVLLSSRYSCCPAAYLVIYLMFLVLICVCEPSRTGGNGMATLGVNWRLDHCAED